VSEFDRFGPFPSLGPGFEVRRWRGSAGEFHGRPLPEPIRPEVWVFEVERPAVVLGSLQSVDVLDEAACAAAGVEIARRRSGGGVVLLEPGRIVWFDVIVPAELLRVVGVGDDVRSSMIWLGDLVAVAAGGLGIDRVDVHRGPPVGSRDICFAGVGPGEVVVDGRKLVGVSQRRTRAGSRFQCAVHTWWNPGAMVGLLRAPPPVGELPAVATLDAARARQLPDVLASTLPT
jgi:lipoate---protein ligase